MNREDIIEELRGIKETTQRDHPGYIVKDVVHYNKKVETTNEEGKVEELDLIVVLVKNVETKEEYKLYYLDGEEIPIIEFLKDRELLNSIQEVIEDTKENEEKPEEEQDKELKKDTLEELEADKEKEECSEVLEEDEKNIKSIAEVEQEEDTKKLESMNHLQEIDADTKVNYYKDMEKALGVKGVQKFVIVYSEDAAKLSETKEQNSSRYSMIAVMDDGSMINLDDRLEEVRSEGKNSIEGRIQTDADEQTRVENNPASIYRIKGSNSNEAFSFENGEYGEIKAYYGNMTETNGTTFVGTQLETNNVWPTSKEVREHASDREGQYYADDKKEETKKHTEHGDEEISIEDSDGDENTFECIEKDWKELATKWGYYKDGKPDEEKAKKVYKEYKYNNPHLSDDEVVQEVSDDLYDQIPGRNLNR